MVISWACSVCLYEQCRESPTDLVVQSMSKITFKIQQSQQVLTVVRYNSPLTVAQAKSAHQEENMSWVGALQEEGSSDRIGGDQQLKPGCAYTLTLRQQAGEHRGLLFFVSKWHSN